MAANLFTRQQRLVVLRMIAADYSTAAILHRLAKLDDTGEPQRYEWKEDQLSAQEKPFPLPTASALGYYRGKYAEDITRLRSERREQALVAGLALKAERVARLCEHADALELVKWVPSENGRLWNEKAWRETLDDIAREMGERRPEAGGGAEEVVKIYLGIDPERI